jgi:hypothetical protein
LSVPVGAVYVTTAPHEPVVFPCVILDGHLIVGACVSVIVTVNEQLAVLPAASVTTNVFVVVPAENVVPLACPAVCAVAAPEQLSVPVGAVYVTISPQDPVVFPCVILDGQLIVGACVSVIVTVNEQLAVLPAASVTTNVFVVVPFEKADPLASPAV